MFPYKVVGDTDVTTLAKNGVYSVKGTPINTPTKDNGIAIVFSDVGSRLYFIFQMWNQLFININQQEKKWFKFSGIAV